MNEAGATSDVEGDEFYDLRGDATPVGHSVTIRLYAYALTRDSRFLDGAHRSLEWLAGRQDEAGGWSRQSAFTLDGAQCVFEGFNTYSARLRPQKSSAHWPASANTGNPSRR